MAITIGIAEESAAKPTVESEVYENEVPISEDHPLAIVMYDA